MSEHFQDSNPYKRNLRFQKITAFQNQFKNDFQFQQSNLSCSEQKKVNLFFESNSIQEEKIPIYYDKDNRICGQSVNISNVILQNKNNLQLRRQKKTLFFQKSAIQFQNSQFQQIKLILFEKFLVQLINHFNPSRVKEQHLCILNKNFSIFDRILNGSKNDSLLIYGVNSTGKSRSVDWALKHNKDFGQITVNCLEFNSEVSFILKLNQQLRIFFDIKATFEVEYDQFSKKSLFAMLQPFIQKSLKKVVLIIQNAQFLVKFTAHKVIYNLSQLAVNSRKNIKIILITRRPNFQKLLDRRQKSRLKLIPLQMLKFRESILQLFKQRLNFIEKQIFSNKNLFFSEFDHRFTFQLKKVLKQWLKRIRDIFCQNQAFRVELQKISKGIQSHLNAACWSMANMLNLEKIQNQSQQELKKQLINCYKMLLTQTDPLPSKNLLKYANLDEKICMSLIYTMLINKRKPYCFKTIIRISWEFKTEKVQKSSNIYLSQINLRKSFLKLIDKKIIYFEEGTENQQMNREIKVAVHLMDIKEAVLGGDNKEDLPYFVKEVLCL